jgi:tryptophan-rich sensory protein
MTRLSFTDVRGLILWMGVTFAAAWIGGTASSGAGGFYGELARPGWAPPAWLFGPVWTLLYILMGLGAWLVWRKRGVPGVSTALALYVVQLALNALWTWLFFAWRSGAAAFIEILVLLAVLAATFVRFRKASSAAALMLVPYILWTGFATILTFSVWKANPLLLG